ncbi:MAG: membrane protein insertase YidC [Alistipes sp.]|nr:membrane protein insertase YidC [Alistipes sp.]
MDKNTIIGIVLMIALFVGFSFYQSHEIEEQQQIVNQKAKIEQAERAMRIAEAEADRMLEEAMTEEERFTRDSIAEVERTNVEVARHGATLYAARTGVVKQEVVANDYITVTFDNRGGKIVDVTLNDYTRYAEGERTELVKLMTPESMRMGINLRRGNEILNTNNYFFTPNVVEFEDHTTITMTLNIERDAWVEYIYTVYRTGNKSRDYVVDFSIKQHNIDQMLSNRDEIVLTWHNKSNKNERSFKNESIATTIEYFADGDVEQLDADGEREEEEGVEWVAFKQQYFSSALISELPMEAAMSFKSAKNERAGYLKEFDAQIAIPHVAGRELYNLAFYYGPNDYKVMKDVEFMGRGCELEKVIPMGGTLIGWWNKVVTIPVFHWLRDLGLGFGLIILLLTILVKAVILPLTYKSYMSTAKMRAIRPELEAINAKYPKQEDAMKKQQATMELYQKVGISPMGGCLPLLIQMPILWAMFRFIPASIELRGEGFLWADDLSTYDSVVQLPFNIPFYGDHISLFALLMALALFGYSFISYQQQSATTAGQPGAGMMKFMMVYFMPLMMLCVMNEFSAGLCYYYFLSQIFTMIIMFVIRRTTNDDEVRAKLMAKKPKKKSKFQERYEEALRQQQDQMTINREQRRHQGR